MSRRNPVILDRVIDPVNAMARPASAFTAVLIQKHCHPLPDPGQPLPVSLRRKPQNIARNPAVHLKHRAQDKNTSALHIQTLQHNVRAGHLQLLCQNRFFHILCQIRHIIDLPVPDIIPVKLKAERKLRKHMLPVIFQVINRNAEHPGRKRALSPE